MRTTGQALYIGVVLALAALAPALRAQEGEGALTCAASAGASPTMRTEGKTELTADVVVTCTGGYPTGSGVPMTSVNFQITLNANVTSRVLSSPWSEALLLLDEPAANAQFPCDQANGTCLGYGNGEGSGYYGAGMQAYFNPNNRNVFQGQAVPGTPTTLVWNNIPFDPPGAGATRVFRFTNLRIDATTLKGGAAVSTVTAAYNSNQLSYGGSEVKLQARPALFEFALSINPSSVAVGTPAATLAATVRDPSDAAPSSGNPIQLGPSAGGVRYGFLRFAEAVAAADKPRTVAQFVSPDVSPPPVNQNLPGGFYNTESGFYNSSFGTYGTRGNLGLAGLADSGTRYMAVFTNVPADFGIYVDLHNTTASTGPTARLVNTDAYGAGPFSAVPGTGMAQLSVNGGTAVAVWEVLQRNPESPDPFDFGVYLSFPSTISTSVPAAILVQMHYAPISGSSSVIPMFGATGSPQTAFTFIAPAPELTVIPSRLTFGATAGGANPAPSSVTLGSTGGPLAYRLSGTAGSLGLATSPTSGIAPATISVSVKSQGLSAGTYLGSFSEAGPNNLLTVPVTLIVAQGPQITSVNPSAVLAGGPAFTLAVNGAFFTSTSNVQWNGAALGTTFLNTGELTAQVPATLIASPGTASITVATADGAVSNAVPVTITAMTITALSPSSVAAGGAAFSLAITGTGFPQGATASVGGTALQPSALSPTQITVNVPATVIAKPGTLPVFVSAPGGAVSNTVNLTVLQPFQITALTPSSITATAPAFSLTITGTGFATGASAMVGGNTLQATSSSPTSLAVMIPASMIAQPGALPVTVLNPGGATSNALTLTVSPAPAITSVSPQTVIPGSAAPTLIVAGTNLPMGAVVRWNGQALATTFVSPTQLTAQVPAALIASAGVASITAVTADGAISNALQVTIALPTPPVISFSAPVSVPSGQDQGVTVNVTGVYPVDLQVTLTLTFAGDGGLPNDPAIQFQNGSRVFTFTIPAGTQPPTAVTVKAGTVAGVITITPSVTAAGVNITPPNVTTQQIAIARAAPSISLISCSTSAGGFTVVLDGFTNTRAASQAAFTFRAASGVNLVTTQLTVDVSSAFSGWFGSSAAAAAGGLFSYTQPFTVQGAATSVASISVTLANATGVSAASTCQLP